MTQIEVHSIIDVLPDINPAGLAIYRDLIAGRYYDLAVDIIGSITIIKMERYSI
jgi:hypothetical protein